MTNSTMTCEAFDAALPDYLEGTLVEPLRAAVNKHLSECVRCTSLVRDLEKIQKEAAALPDLIPARDLWQGIEARITAPVIPLATRPTHTRRFTAAWMGVAAAALIVSTAGITYRLTSRSFDRGAVTVAAVTSSNSQPEPESVDSGTAPASTTANPVDIRETSTTSTPRRIFTIDFPARQEVSVARLVNQEVSQAVYDKEIDKLQQIVTERRTQLDPSTIAIIETNLKIIDAAIASSKSALEKDPGSRLLGDQLTHALDKKVELLRTAALLPAST